MQPVTVITSPNIAFIKHWGNSEDPAIIQKRTIAGELFGDCEAHLLQYDHFQVDVKPEGNIQIFGNCDMPVVIV